jgi:spermidine synthase
MPHRSPAALPPDQNSSPSVFVETRPDGLAFYINGDLQFDTADEALYHEHLTVPAIALAVQRFPQQPLRVLICGGGDDLVARDVLRFPQVSEVVLVDFSEAVLELARTVFAPYNANSLSQEWELNWGESRVTVHTQEAFEFVTGLPDRCFHAVICDFTVPTTPPETAVYSLEWFTALHRVLIPSGLVALNAVSPTHTTTAFWCIYQTLFAAGLSPKPLQLPIPSFRRMDYGDWGFFLASDQAIQATELAALTIPAGLRAFVPETWRSHCVLASDIAQIRHQVYLHTLDSPQLFYYLINPQASLELLTAQVECADAVVPIDFWAIAESGTPNIGTFDRLQLETMAQRWLNSLDSDQAVDLTQLIPVQHYRQTPKMVAEWARHLKALLLEIDLKELLFQLSDRAQDLPPRLAAELRQLVAKLRSGQPITTLSTHTVELLTVLSVTLLMANLATPDAAFAKGSSSSFTSSGGGYGSDYGDSYSDGSFGGLGFFMMMIGGIWLSVLSHCRSDD